MGYHLNQDLNGKPLQARNKAKDLIASGAIPTDSTFKPDLVCVVENGYFDAAAWCYNLEERNAFHNPDGRPKTWLIVPGVEKLVN